MFFTIALWLSAFALQEIDPNEISENLLNYIYYDGRQTHTILYEDIKKSNTSDYQTNLHEYYNEFNEIEKEAILKNDIYEKDKYLDISKQNFTKTILSLYGNNTIFQMKLEDLVVLVNDNILSDIQSVIMWESLLHQKTDRTKLLYGREEFMPDSEIYMFNLIPLKAQGVFFSSILTFLIIHNFQIFLIRKDRTTLIFNTFSILFSLFWCCKFYDWKYYLSSSIVFFQLSLGLKFFIDSIMLHLGFLKDDFDIFISISKTKTQTQFLLKFLIYNTMAIIIGLLCFLKFNYLVNYIIFYISIIQIIYLTSFFFQFEVSPYFQPLKHFLIITAGILNFIITKMHKRITHQNNKPDSFYILSDCFSYLCISFISDYLFTQINNISHLFYEKELDGDKFNDKIAEIVKNIKEHHKKFSLDDCLWLLVFKLGYVINYIGLSDSNMISFIFSFHYFKIIFKVFGRVYNIKILRIFYCICFFTLIISNQIMSTRYDNYIFEVIGISTYNFNSIIRAFIKILSLVYLFSLIIINSEFFFHHRKDNNSEIFDQDSDELIRNLEISAMIDKKRKKRTKTIEIVIKEPSLRLSNIIYIHADLYLNYFNICLIYYLIKDVERNYIVIILYIMLIAIFMIRIFFIITEMRNDYEYIIGFFISFMLGLRLMTLTINHSALYSCTCFYLLLLITLYCLIDRRRILITALILFHLFSACLYFTSLFLFVLMSILVCLPTAFRREEKRFSHSTATMIIPCILIIVFQIYGVKYIFSIFNDFNENLKELIEFDIFTFVQRIVHGYSKEFIIIKKIIEIANNT